MKLNKQYAITAAKNVFGPISWMIGAVLVLVVIYGVGNWISTTYKYGIFFNLAVALCAMITTIWCSEYSKAKWRAENPPSIWDGR